MLLFYVKYRWYFHLGIQKNKRGESDILFSILIYCEIILSRNVFNYDESLLFFKCVPNSNLIQANATMQRTGNCSNVPGLEKI